MCQSTCCLDLLHCRRLHLLHLLLELLHLVTEPVHLLAILLCLCCLPLLHAMPLSHHLLVCGWDPVLRAAPLMHGGLEVLPLHIHTAGAGSTTRHGKGNEDTARGTVSGDVWSHAGCGGRGREAWVQ